MLPGAHDPGSIIVSILLYSHTFNMLLLYKKLFSETNAEQELFDSLQIQTTP